MEFTRECGGCAQLMFASVRVKSFAFKGRPVDLLSGLAKKVSIADARRFVLPVYRAVGGVGLPLVLGSR